MNYLLGKDRDREHAKVLQGNPELTERLADNLEFKNRYTVGVLSFQLLKIKILIKLSNKHHVFMSRVVLAVFFEYSTKCIVEFVRNRI